MARCPKWHALMKIVLATHIPCCYEQASYAIQGTPDVVQQHYGRSRPQDKAARGKDSQSSLGSCVPDGLATEELVYASPCNCPTCGGTSLLKAADRVIQVLEHVDQIILNILRVGGRPHMGLEPAAQFLVPNF